MQEYEVKEDPAAWTGPLSGEKAVVKNQGLNGIHIDALLKVLNKLDKLTDEYGTHLIDEAKFEIFDGNANGVTVLVAFDEEIGLHYLVGVD